MNPIANSNTSLHVLTALCVCVFSKGKPHNSGAGGLDERSDEEIPQVC